MGFWPLVAGLFTLRWLFGKNDDGDLLLAQSGDADEFEDEEFEDDDFEDDESEDELGADSEPDEWL